MSKELDYITELERKNRLLGERCNQLLKDKGELTDKVKELQDHLAEEVELHLHAEEYIKSLEKENAELKNKLTEKVTLESLDVVSAKMNDLEEENNKLLDVINNQDVKIADLEKQIEKMKCCANCKSFRGYGETCEGWGEPVLNLNCDCTEWKLKE